MVPITCYARALDMVDALLLITERSEEAGSGRVEFMNKALREYLGVAEEDTQEINSDTFVIHLHDGTTSITTGHIVLHDKLGNGM
jgi:PAS domain-containing protein